MVTVFTENMKEIEWLAGRGYNTMGVTFPVHYEGKKDRAAGPLLTVLWENLTDPILTGREQLGFSKIYCELPEPLVRADIEFCDYFTLAKSTAPVRYMRDTVEHQHGWQGQLGITRTEQLCITTFQQFALVVTLLLRSDHICASPG